MMAGSLSCLRAAEKDKPVDMSPGETGGDRKAKLVTRIFRVDPGFQQESVSKVPGQTVEEMLKLQGIPFPPGAAVITRGATAGQLIVRNTEANLVLVEAYIKKCNARSPR